MAQQEHELHVWEHPSLHHDKTSDLKYPDSPVEIVYDSSEYDWWRRDELGDLIIGRYAKRTAYQNDNTTRQVPYEVTTFIVPRGMYAKVQEVSVDSGRAAGTALMGEYNGRSIMGSPSSNGRHGSQLDQREDPFEPEEDRRQPVEPQPTVPVAAAVTPPPSELPFFRM